MPGISIISPANTREFKEMITWSKEYNHPLIIRYPRGRVDNDCSFDFEFGKWKFEGELNSDVMIIASGATMVTLALKCRGELIKAGISACVVNASTLKPIDENFLRNCSNKKIVILEENVLHGGLFGAVSEFFFKNDIFANVLPVSFDDTFVPQGSIKELYAKYGFELGQIFNKILNFFNKYKK